jgi:hypothetical protein
MNTACGVYLAMNEGKNPGNSLAVPTFKKQRGKEESWKERGLAREEG